MSARLVLQRAVIPAVVLAVGGCGTVSTGPVTLRDMPSTAFMRCEIPPGRATWANVTLTGGEPPFRGVWIIDGEVDSADPQRAVPVPDGTRLELLVTLVGHEQTFRVREFNRHGLVGTVWWTNGSGGYPPCGPDGEPEAEG